MTTSSLIRFHPVRAGSIEKPRSATEYDRPKRISFHPYAASGIAMACEDCKGSKSVFHRSPPSKEKTIALQMSYLQAPSSAFTPPVLTNIKNWKLC
jgi:hypothetical protein